MFRRTTTLLVASASLLTCFCFGCGDKQNPLGDYSGSSADGGTTVSYAQTIAPMMAASCTVSDCHGGASPVMGIGLDTYERVRANAAASNATIKFGGMPIGSGAPLTDTDIANFDAWVKAGTPNN